MNINVATCRRWMLVLTVCLLAGSACAVTRTWGGSTTNWNDTANWTGNIVPTNGDAVIIPNAGARPSMPPGTYPSDGGAFLSFELQAGATNICLGDPTAANTNSGGTVAIPHGTGVAINCQSALINGTLTADTKGFGVGAGPCKGTGQYGASHGGFGYGRSAAYCYGKILEPTALGSGGWWGAYGGGAIKLNVMGLLTVNGIISADANGQLGYGYNDSGSGGSIWLIADSFAGSGIIRARGGAGTVAANCSGGGRIAIVCNTTTFSGAIALAGGQVVTAQPTAQPGTLHFPQWIDSRHGSSDNPTNITLIGNDAGFQYWFPDWTTTNYWNLALSNAWFECYGGSVSISNLDLTKAIFRIVDGKMTNLFVTGNMSLTNSILYPPLNGIYEMSGDMTIHTDAVVYVLSDTTAVNADSGGTPGVPHGIGLSMRCRNATILGLVNAIGAGFYSGGPGRSTGGGSYGGSGGYSSAPKCYGSLTRPTALGSSGWFTDYGGGAVKIQATGTLALNGTINANGTAFGNSVGSGGSVWLLAGILAGNGKISANGYDGSSYGGGGGGRIAIEYGAWNYSGTNTVKGGAATIPGKTGTVFLCQSPWLGTTFSNGVNGRRLDTQFSVSSNNVQIARAITRFDTSLQWRDFSTDTSTNIVVTNIAAYSISGLRPSRGYVVYRDGAPQFGGQLFTGTNGVLTFTNTLDGLRTFFVTPAERGTILTIY